MNTLDLIDQLEQTVAEQAREIERLENELNDCGDWDAKQLQVIHGLHDDIAALRAQPCAVVLPEGKPYHDYQPLFDKGEAIGHNNALAEVTRLNAAPAPTVEPTQSAQDNYEHFLAYSELADDPMLRYAYMHGVGADFDKPAHSDVIVPRETPWRHGAAAAQKLCDKIAGDHRSYTDLERKGAGECSAAIRALLAGGEV
jgi:hypothetical protein